SATRRSWSPFTYECRSTTAMASQPSPASCRTAVRTLSSSSGRRTSPVGPRPLEVVATLPVGAHDLEDVPAPDSGDQARLDTRALDERVRDERRAVVDQAHARAAIARN